MVVLMLLCTGALAEETGFGGTKELPEFRSLQPGLTLQAVAMREASRGIHLGVFGLEETPLAELPEGYLDACYLIGRDVPVYGEEITVLYEISSGVFSVAHGYAAFAEEKDAQAYYKKVSAEMQALYGGPESNMEWEIGYGYRIPGDPEEQEAEGFSGTVSIKVEKLEDVLGDNADALREEGFEIPEDGWLVSFGLAQAYRVNPLRQDEAFYLDTRIGE